MAVVLRSCIVCNTEFPSKNMRARFCKSTCKSIHHRATKKPETPTMKTEEVNTMSTPSQLFQPDAAHLKRLQDIEVDRYNSETQCNIQGKEQMGVMEVFEVQGLQQALDKYAELTIIQGYRATGEITHLPKLIAGPTVDWVVLSLRKPESQVEQEIAQIKAQVEQQYLQRLEVEKAACVAKEVESLLAGEKRRKQQAEFDAKAAQEAEEYARVEAEVLAALGGKQ